jgi:hypothetical protein
MAQLELSTTREREFVTIDGKDYTLRAWDDMALQESLDARRAIKKLTLGEWEKVTGRQTVALQEAVEKVVRWLVPALEEETLGKLNFAKRSAIVLTAAQGSADFMPAKEGETEI